MPTYLPNKSVNPPDKPEKAIKNITNSIRKGLRDLQEGHSAKELGKTSKEPSLPACAGDPAIPDNRTSWLEGDDGTIEERLLRFENVHWEPLHMLQEMRAMAWKRSFVAACVHKLLDKLRSEASESLKVTLRPKASVERKTASASVNTIRRWIFGAALINAIVNKLWSNWGPKAALVYEACASKGYNLLFDAANFVPVRNNKMSSIRSISNESFEEVVDGVALNLINCGEPSSSLCSHIFHPALYISSVLYAWKAKYVFSPVGAAADRGTQ